MSDLDDDEFPRWFGDYVLLKSLGAGGMGQVFLARLPGLQGIERLCVIKTLKKQWTSDREYVARFVDEARVVVQLAHRNICTVFDVGSVHDTYYMAMDLAPGRDLQSVLHRASKRGLTVPLDLALSIAVEITDALDAAHRLVDPETDAPVGLVHRDVSPHNVLVSFDGEVKLIDFGLATSSLKHERTEPGVVLGKLAYMAPEHARGDVVDRRSDLFAVGVVLYEMISGHRFWEGLSVEQVWQRVGRGDWRPPGLDALPAPIVAVLERTLAARAADRFPSGAELRAALLSAQLSRGLVAGSAELRDFIELLFPGDAQADRRERAALGKLVPAAGNDADAVRIASTPGRPKAVLPPLVVDDVHDRPTGIVPRSVSSPDVSTEDEAAPVVSFTTKRAALPTQIVRAAPSSSSLTPSPVGSSAWVLLSGFVVLGVLTGIAAAAWNRDPVVVAVAVVDAGVAAAEPPLVAVIPPPLEVAPLEVAPLEVAPLEVAPLEPEPLEPEPPPRGPAVRRNKKKAPTSTPLPLPAVLPRLVDERVALLQSHCGGVECAAGLSRRFRSFSSMAPDVATRFVADVGACLDTCRAR